MATNVVGTPGSGYPYNPMGTPTTVGTGQGTTTTQGSSTPSIMQSPQSEYQLALAQSIGQAGNQQYGWAQNQYGYLQGLANEAVPQYLQGAATSNQLANQQLQQYEGMYLPAQQQFNNLAQTWASPARTAQAMGSAEANATQDAASSWNNTRQQLQSMGVDPSSGEYAGLQSAANTAAGASAAGAGNQAQQAVQQQGLGLQEQNIGFGQTMPASALNAINAGYAGQAGAINTGQSTVNTGVNAFNGANQFYNTAMGIQSPPVGNTQQNTTNTQYTQQNAGWTPKVQGGNIGNGTATGGLAAGGLVEPGDSYRRGGKVRGGHGGKHGGMGGGAGAGGGATGDPAPRPQMIANPAGDFSNVGYNYNLQAGGPHAPTPGTTFDTSSSTPSPGSPGSGGAPNRGSATPNAAYGPPIDVGASMDPTMPSDGGGVAQGGLPMQPHGHQGRPHPPHPYHTNGLPDASTGGHVPYELSPSHGHTTDDVVANLNAGEFVLPRRTVHHLGHKFLYDLVGKADKEMGMHPQPVGGKPVKPGSGADKARSSAESQNFLSGGGI